MPPNSKLPSYILIDGDQDPAHLGRSTQACLPDYQIVEAKIVSQALHSLDLGSLIVCVRTRPAQSIGPILVDIAPNASGPQIAVVVLR
jgi:hypothetical protein